MNNSIKISIVVPVKNGIDTLERLIAGIKLQTIFQRTEVVVVDSGSNDGSVEYLQQFDFVNVIPIDPKTFNHGATRNLAVQHCKGEFILMTVQDAWTEDPHLLERMASHFKDQDVVGVVGHQKVPHVKGMNPHEWFRPVGNPKARKIKFDIEEYKNLSNEEKYKNSKWDNVIAMYRKETLIYIPFEITNFSEDLAWAKKILSQGYALVSDPRNLVNHYHHAYPEYVLKRKFIELYTKYKIFNWKVDYNVPLKRYVLVLIRNFKWNLHPKWIIFNFKIIFAQNKANNIFHKACSKGDNFLDKKFNELCGEIPQGSQFKI
jgi:rhamnosyltransferase